MDSTTLITFHYKTRPDVRSVELFGSWDNFSRPYGMQRDAHKGRGSWTGCHSFENIICDGDRFDQTKPRNGALKQGGTYWYYYKLDDEEESCDPTQPSTGTCPLLPGQLVNTLDIPVEMPEPPQRVSSASDSIPFMLSTQMTTNPADRYKKIYRKHPTKLPRYYCSSDALRERFYADGNRFSAGQEAPRMRNRGLSPETRSTKRVRCEEPSYQKPGFCQIEVTPEDMAMLSEISGQRPQTPVQEEEEDMPVLRPFGPCFDSPIREDERPVTRGFMDFSKGLGFSFFGSNKKSPKKTDGLSEDVPMDYQYTSTPPPQYDGSADQPQAIVTPSEKTRNEDWPLPRVNPLRSNPISSSTTQTNIPTLDLESVIHYPSPAPTSTSLSRYDDYHPGFGPTSRQTPGSGLFDMISPSFTVDTAASSPGIPTPPGGRSHFSLQKPRQTHNTDSALSSFSDMEPTDVDELDMKNGLEDLSRRLSALTSSSSEYEDEDDEDNSDSDSLFHVVKKTTEFYAFCPPIGREQDMDKQQPYQNGSSATLKPGSKQQRRLELRGESVGVFKLDLEADECGHGFSEDVFEALGMEI